MKMRNAALGTSWNKTLFFQVISFSKPITLPRTQITCDISYSLNAFSCLPIQHFCASDNHKCKKALAAHYILRQPKIPSRSLNVDYRVNKIKKPKDWINEGLMTEWCSYQITHVWARFCYLQLSDLLLLFPSLLMCKLAAASAFARPYPLSIPAQSSFILSEQQD